MPVPITFFKKAESAHRVDRKFDEIAKRHGYTLVKRADSLGNLGKVGYKKR